MLLSDVGILGYQQSLALSEALKTTNSLREHIPSRSFASRRRQCQVPCRPASASHAGRSEHDALNRSQLFPNRRGLQVFSAAHTWVFYWLTRDKKCADDVAYKRLPSRKRGNLILPTDSRVPQGGPSAILSRSVEQHHKIASPKATRVKTLGPGTAATPSLMERMEKPLPLRYGSYCQSGLIPETRI